ncbi:hypothetical protein GCM10009623_01310 [Nocardioides aestuarii]|uniref:Secreted protein n=1 Tax=Nocardioides aestuarii TaxID=252231 RepID=A0ABW4TJN7_9ACTN
MRGKSASASVLALAGCLLHATPAEAAEAVHIEAATVFDGSAAFTSNLDGCESGTVENGSFRVQGSRNSGIFNGFKVFTCASGDEFVIRLQARFGEGGSTGTWAFTGGSYAGNGTLVGIPFAVGEGITDVYDGTLRP